MTTPCVATKVTMLCVSNPPKTEYSGPPHPPPSSSPQGCPRAHQLKFQVFDTVRRTILPYKCKTRVLNPSGRRKASFFSAPTSSGYKTNFTFRMKTPLPNYNYRKPNLLVTIISFTAKYAERGPSYTSLGSEVDSSMELPDSPRQSSPFSVSLPHHTGYLGFCPSSTEQGPLWLPGEDYGCPFLRTTFKNT